jgi:hypothetical protein
MEQIETLEQSSAETIVQQSTNNLPMSQKPFIIANTIDVSLDEMKNHHIIPVFTKDNEPLISHTDLIDLTESIARDVFHGEHIYKPQVRVSHPIKGRIPDAKDKPANMLLDSEKTLYYERMMFAIEIPSINDEVDGHKLSLTIGGVKSYNNDNLYSRSLRDQHFKVFIGFKNKICSNLCVWTDGLMSDLKVKNASQLQAAVRTMIESYNQNLNLFHLKKLSEHSITEQQFANLVGRCRMYPHLPREVKSEIPPILFGDQQLGSVVKDYYREDSFCKDDSGNINLWRLYNLFTGANKNSYIDSFLERSVNAFNLVEQIRFSLEAKSDCWYMN